MRLTRSGLVLAAATGLLVAACANGGSGTTAATPTTPAGPGTSASEPPLDLPSPTSSRAKGGRTVVVSGTVELGVEPSCRLLGDYLLLGGPRADLRPGRSVTVTGHLAMGLVTTCQQGTPLVVDRVTPGR